MKQVCDWSFVGFIKSKKAQQKTFNNDETLKSDRKISEFIYYNRLK